MKELLLLLLVTIVIIYSTYTTNIWRIKEQISHSDDSNVDDGGGDCDDDTNLLREEMEQMEISLHEYDENARFRIWYRKHYSKCVKPNWTKTHAYPALSRLAIVFKSWSTSPLSSAELLHVSAELNPQNFLYSL